MCGQHYRSDVTDGEALGVIIAERLAHKPAFQSLLEGARLEFKTSGLVRD